jgi:hypothetical protein
MPDASRNVCDRLVQWQATRTAAATPVTKVGFRSDFDARIKEACTGAITRGLIGWGDRKGKSCRVGKLALNWNATTIDVWGPQQSLSELTTTRRILAGLLQAGAMPKVGAKLDTARPYWTTDNLMARPTFAPGIVVTLALRGQDDVALDGWMLLIDRI